MFLVRVPVLSEQMQDVDPRVSTDSKFLTSTFLDAILFAVRARLTVTVARRPSGTLATMIPIAKITLTIGSYPIINPAMKNVTPKKIATADTILINRSISIANVVFELLAD